MKIYELDRTEGKKYKIVNDDRLSKEIEPLTWTFSSDGSLTSSEGKDIGIYFNTGRILNFEFEEVKKSKELTGYERVKEDKFYYTIGKIGVFQTIEFFDEGDDSNYKNGDYYSNRETAEKEAKIINLYRKMKRFSVENGWRDEMFSLDTNFYKFSIFINYGTKSLGIAKNNFYPDFLEIYFTSKEIAEKAIEIFGEEIKEVYGL